MKTPAKLGLGCATLTPLVSALVLGCYIGYELIAWDLEHRGLAAPPDPVGGLIDGPFAAEHWIAFGVVAVSIALLELALTVVLAVHAARDPRLPGWAIAVWLAGFLLAGPLALPLYVVLYVLREPPPKRVADLDRSPIAA